MVNKQNMWFLTLFSLILVLSVYYVTMPNELLLTNNSNVSDSDDEKEEATEATVSVEESSLVEMMKVEDESSVQETINELNQTLTNMDVSIDERNKAYEELKNINEVNSLEETLESKLGDKYACKTFVKINGEQIRVVLEIEDGSKELANEIMRLVQAEFDSKKSISVQFTK